MMPSLARSLFAGHAAPILLDYFGDERVRLTYTIGNTEVSGIIGVVRDQQKAFEEDAVGDVLKHDRMSIVICTDPASPWGGVADPQLKAIWTLTEEDGTESQWSCDTQIGRGIEALSKTFALIHLVRLGTVSKSIPNYRIQ